MDKPNDVTPIRIVTAPMIDAAADELWKWIVFEMGYDETMPLNAAREQAKRILGAAIEQAGEEVEIREE